MSTDTWPDGLRLDLDPDEEGPEPIPALRVLTLGDILGEPVGEDAYDFWRSG